MCDVARQASRDAQRAGDDERAALILNVAAEKE